jgi:hypothetical protein
MQTAVSVKAGGAFLAGVALALGGAYTYFKLADPRPVVQPQEAQQVVQQEAQPVAKVTPASAPEPAPSPVVETAEPKIIHPKLVLPKPRVTSRPVSLAMATPPPASSQQPAPVPDPPPDPVPAPAPAQVFTAPVPQPPPPAVEPQPHTVTIPEGTSVAVRLNEKISTDHNYTGDTFRATLEAPLVVDGFIIADRGAKVLGKVVKAQKPGKLEGAAELSLALTEISTTDGQHLHLETNQSLRKGPSNTTQEAEKMGGGAALGAIIGAIAGGGKGAAIGLGAGGAAGAGAVLLGHGKPAVIDNETRLTFTLATPATITEQLHSR